MKKIPNIVDIAINKTQEFSTEKFFNNNRFPRVVSFVNSFSYYILLERGDLLEKVHDLYIDGAFLVYLNNLFYPKKLRTSFDFSSIADDVFCYAQKNQKNVAIIGGSENEVVEACRNIKNRYEEISICFRRSGYFSNDLERNDCIEKVKSLHADIVVVGMGCPLQEEFSVRLFDSLDAQKIAIFTCGGFISQVAAKADYYHPLIKRFGLRWLQRAVLHHHVRKRLVLDYPKFLVKYLKECGF